MSWMRPKTRPYAGCAALAVSLLLGACAAGGGPVTAPGREPVLPGDAGTATRTSTESGDESPTGTAPDAEGSGAGTVAGPATDDPAARAVAVLERWDTARAAAYRAGDAAAIGELHARGSTAGRRDVAVLRAYERRGVRLELRTVTDRLTVLVSEPRRVVVLRRARVEAVARRAGERRALPTGKTRWQRLVLERSDGRWRLRSATASRGSPREPP